jgi:alpha-D-xyloside xylohydrolase
MPNLCKNTCAGIFTLWASISVFAANPQQPLLNDPVDVSGDFRDFSNFYYLADELAEFDPATHSGKIAYERARYHVRHAFDNDLAMLESTPANEFPDNQYVANPTLPFSIDFVSPRTVRIRMTSGPQVHPPQDELMLAGNVPKDDSWKYKNFPAVTATRAWAGPSPFLKSRGVLKFVTRPASC